MNAHWVPLAYGGWALLAYACAGGLAVRAMRGLALAGWSPVHDVLAFLLWPYWLAVWAATFVSGMLEALRELRR